MSHPSPRPASTGLPFDWMEPRRAAERPKIDRTRRETMYRAELEERAALLHRLGYSRERTRGRLLANLDWDFGAGGPLDAAAVEAIVERAFGPATSGKSAPRGKGGPR
jgi:hypothetical protein